MPGPERVMDEVGLTHISFSVSDIPAVVAKVAEFGGTVVDAAVSETMAMIRDPDGQLLELVSDGWLAALPRGRKRSSVLHLPRNTRPPAVE